MVLLKIGVKADNISPYANLVDDSGFGGICLITFPLRSGATFFASLFRG